MPDVSRAQQGFMAMSRTPKGRAKLRSHGKTPAPAKVANEFLQADKGRHFPPLKRVKI